MTVSTTTSTAQFDPNGVTINFPFAFRFFAATDLKVFWQKPDGTIQLLTLNSNYTVQGAGNDAGGSITTIGTPLPNGLLVVSRIMVATQLTSFRNQGEFFAEIHEDAFDKLVMLVQQTIDNQARGITVPIADPLNINLVIPGVGARGGRVMAFDADGNVDVSNLTLEQIEQQPALALDSAQQAAESALAAGDSKDAAALSATSSANSAALAQKWAENPEDTPVTAGLFSAHHWANKAAAAVLRSQRQIIPITASVAANAMTLGLPKTPIAFRSSSLTSGTVNIRDLAADLSLVIPSGATLGTTSATLGRVMLLAIDNAGTVELAAVNVSGGVNLDETGLISTTAITSGASSASVIYSTTARTNVPYRIVGFVDFTQATAGTWVTAPSRIQGAGGQSVAMNAIGMGQTWKNVAASRAVSTNYVNTTGRPIMVSCSLSSSSANSHISLTVNGVNVSDAQIYANGATGALSAIVPPGGVYSAQGTAAAVYTWAELS